MPLAQSHCTFTVSLTHSLGVLPVRRLQALQPELDAALRDKYMCYLAFRRREREDQLERMVLDLTAVETFPPELATADKDDAADGTPLLCHFIRMHQTFF